MSNLATAIKAALFARDVRSKHLHHHHKSTAFDLQAMALPRRVPWTSQEEYEEVFGLLFASNGDLNAQRRAVDRVRDLEEAFALIAEL